MDLEALYEMLDISDGSEFEYFENFADLVECEAAMDSEVLYTLLETVDCKVFAELCESYFYDLLESVPGDQIDLYNLLEHIKRALVGLTVIREEADAARSLLHLADALNQFRLWYARDSRAELRDLDTGEVLADMPVRDALAAARLERLGDGEYGYDFSQALDYDLEAYDMLCADLMDE